MSSNSPVLPGLPPSRAELDEQRKAAAALLAVQGASTLALSDAEVAEALMSAVCAHVLQCGDPSIGPESKRAMLEELLSLRWPIAVAAWEANK